MYPVQTVISDDGMIEFVMPESQPLLPEDWMKYRANSHDDVTIYGSVSDAVKGLVDQIIETIAPQWVEVWQYRLFVKLPNTATSTGFNTADNAVRRLLSSTYK